MTVCACGSGLREVRCCRLDAAAIPDAEAMRPLQPMLSEALARAGQDEALLLAVLELAPTHPDALLALHARRAAEGKAAAARALLERYVAHHPNDPRARSELALLLMQEGEDGIEHARSAVRLAPLSARAHDVLGMVLIEAHRPQAGAWHCARAVALSERRDPALLANMAWGLKAAEAVVR